MIDSRLFLCILNGWPVRRHSSIILHSIILNSRKCCNINSLIPWGPLSLVLRSGIHLMRQSHVCMSILVAWARVMIWRLSVLRILLLLMIVKIVRSVSNWLEFKNVLLANCVRYGCLVSRLLHPHSSLCGEGWLNCNLCFRLHKLFITQLNVLEEPVLIEI